MTGEPAHVFTETYQLSDSLHAREQRQVDFQPAVQATRLATQKQTGLVSLALKRGFAYALRWLTRAILLSPVLCLVQVLVEHGWVIVAFVGIVCLFFGMLNLYLLASAVHWLRTRHAQPGPPFDRPRREHVSLREHRFEGVVRALDGATPAVLFTDLFDEERPSRVCFGDDFLLEVEGDEPVVVRIETSVALFGRVESVAPATLPTPVRRLLGVGPDDEPYRGVVLRPGDRVVVHSRVPPSRVGPLESFELGRRRRSARRETSAYRDGSSGKLLTHDLSMPLAIEIGVR